MSMGHSELFHQHYQPLLFPSTEVMPPGCYRCPHNQARPEQADARSYRKCNWECVDAVEKAFTTSDNVAALVLEPKVQGAAGFLMHPAGYLKKAASIARNYGAKLILDEVMTGFGRTGSDFAFQSEDIQPDIIALAKGITGGTLPLAATLCREDIFEGFAGDLSKTFYHGHSYTGNPLGCAAAIASLDELQSDACVAARQQIEQGLQAIGQKFWSHANVGDVRQQGCILAIELVADTNTREAFPYQQRLGATICQQAAQNGLLTRPVGDVLLLMPPYSSTGEQIEEMGDTLFKATKTIL
jgi:adenosylmethionine-8-amino-7-oxononanoate aminotransferase